MPPRPALPTNRYVQRTAAKSGTCSICGYQTATLFMTEQTTPRDWFYVCVKHTLATDFCTVVEKEKYASDSESTKAADSKPKPKALHDADNSKNGDSTNVAAPAVEPKRLYRLHKDYFYLRTRPFVRRWKQEQADKLAQKLPSVPRTAL